MKYSLLMIFICTSCASTDQVDCDDPLYTYSFHENYSRYLFEHNVMPYEGYTELESFLPSKEEVAVTDSVLNASGFNTKDVEFAQYGGFVSHSGDQIVAANYVYDESKEYPQARCDWFFGLGRYFEESTRQGYVNVSTRIIYEIR